MDSTLPDRLRQLDDHKAVRLLDQYASRLFDGMETTPQELLAGVVPELRDSPIVRGAETMSADERDRPLSTAQSVDLARQLLDCFARDPDLAPSLEETLDEYRDDTLLVGAILATGVAVSMVIVAATTTFKGRVGKFRIEKGTAQPEQLREIARVFSPSPARASEDPA
ncbi:MAG: hypothetical protein ACYTG1_00935 [Planctomycetota bacterium]|jgi:hypothetical protein